MKGKRLKLKFQCTVNKLVILFYVVSNKDWRKKKMSWEGVTYIQRYAKKGRIKIYDTTVRIFSAQY